MFKRERNCFSKKGSALEQECRPFLAVLQLPVAPQCTGNHTITAPFKDIGAKTGTTYAVQELLSGTAMPDATAAVSVLVGEHDIAVLKLTPK